MIASRLKLARNFSVTQQHVDILRTGTEMLNPCIKLIIRLALIKIYHLHMSSRVLQWFLKLPQWNLHVNGTIFESGLRFHGCSQWNYHVNRTTFENLKPVWVHFGSHVNVLSKYIQCIGNPISPVDLFMIEA